MRTVTRCHLALVMMLCSSRALISRNQSYEPFCLHTKSALGRTQCSFLQRSVVTESLLFFWTIWTADQLVEECLISAETTLIQNYMTLCHEARTWNSNGLLPLHINISLLLEPDSSCEFRASAVGSFTRHRMNLDKGHQLGTKIRQKRAWIFPGTLWCGRGSTAGEYEQLGMFEHVDRCCREHDHCSYIIRPFTVNFGVLNPSFFTISHCDCDHRFKQCLLSGNDTVSNMVGYTFFNILKLRCFELIQKRRCTQLNWFGMCTVAQVAPFAILKNPTPYNLSNADPLTSGTDLQRYQLQPSANGKKKNNKPQRTKQSKMLKRNYPVALAKENTILLSGKVQKHYVKTKKFSPRTTVLPSIWKNSTPPDSITIHNTTFFHQKYQTIIKPRTLSMHKSKRIPLHQTIPSQGPTKITHAHAKLSPVNGYNAQIPMATPLQKSVTYTRKATTTQNAFHKPPKSKHNCVVSQRDYNFQSTQEKGQEYKVDDASMLKSFHATVSPKFLPISLASIFPRTGKLFVNKQTKTQTSKQAKVPSKTNAPNEHTVSIKSQSQATSGTTNSFLTSTIKTTHPKQKIKANHRKNKSANVTKRPKIRNATSANFTPTTQSKSTLWNDIILSPKATLFFNVSSLKSWESIRFKNSSSTNQKTLSSDMENMKDKKRCKPPKNSVNNKNMTTTSRSTTPEKNSTVPQYKTVSSTEITKTQSYSVWKKNNSTSEETTGSLSICDAFRYLDHCKYRIGPMEKIYGHHNKESTTIYHCDCIYRFTANLKQFKEANILQSLLGKFVSLSCIKIPNIKECKINIRCPAIIFKTTELDSSLKKMEEDHATIKHNKQLTNKRLPRQLYKYCLRILNNKNPKHVKKRPL